MIVEILNRNFAYATSASADLRLLILDQAGYDFFLDPDNCHWNNDNKSWDSSCASKAIFISDPKTILTYVCAPGCLYNELHAITFNGGDFASSLATSMHFHTNIGNFDVVGNSSVWVAWLAAFVLVALFIFPFRNSVEPGPDGERNCCLSCKDICGKCFSAQRALMCACSIVVCGSAFYYYAISGYGYSAFTLISLVLVSLFQVRFTLIHISIT
jgi:hypothetical protein